MGKIIKYECEVCKKLYDKKEDYDHCYYNHTIKDKLAAFKGSIICPFCKGTGQIDGVDGCDILTCYDCGGFGIVIPEESTTYNYKQIKRDTDE